MRFLVLGVLLTGQAAFAGAPATSPRPVPREAAQELRIPTVVTTSATIRPRPRPAAALAETRRLQSAVTLAPTSDDMAANTSGVAFVATAGQVMSPVPRLRPGWIVDKAMAKRREARRGAVCGDVDIQGQALGNVPGNGACGIQNAVAVRSVAGVTLSQQARMDCATAKALKRWVEKGVKPAFGSAGGGVTRLRVAAHYACRTRNNQRGAKLSEHGRGRAIDISGFYLADGTLVDVLKGWRSQTWSRPLKRAHKAACGPFGTVLGPEADRFHQDHLHMDTARYRSGSYCR